MDDADGLAPTEAFGLLSHEVRFDIVRALAAERRLNWERTGLSFADLRRAVGVDDAGNFSYHLDRLRDRFVVERDGEYVATYAGMEAVGAVLQGTYTERADRAPERIDAACPTCDGAVRAAYEYPMLSVSCPDHGVLFATSVPPGATTGRSLAALDGGTLSAWLDGESRVVRTERR
ncbi:winged helix-turn-helix domain-containing protein [Halosegnis marinus]|uniref:Winged helix-turn-helix domain-containing protein n=1 Tax=Halosegnis marinus TaxID=3034023 RepID=A0ABD5ZP68_9EURY|nr:winged helix-turn-helix domain-containing protein [Halosegnis sp. DT85]